MSADTDPDTTTAVTLFCAAEPCGEAIALRTGALDLTLQRGRLHSLCVDGVEVWRGILFLYRDPDWGTPEVAIANLVHETRGKGFRLAFDAHCATQP